MIKQLEIHNNHDIVIFANELLLQIKNNKTEWNKYFICSSNNKHYINSKHTQRFNDFIVNDKIIDIIKNVIDIMINNGFTHTFDEQNIESYNVELHCTNADIDYVYPWSVIHKDNDNGILVNTFICYFDVDCIGGELAFYDLDEKTILTTITTKLLNDNKKVVIFSGDILHNPLKIKKGHRYALSFHIPI
jgi:hypothetical protein